MDPSDTDNANAKAFYGNQRHDTPRSCSSGWGFSGKPENRSFCSKETNKFGNSVSSFTFFGSSSAQTASAPTPCRSRCGSCRRKLGLIWFPCRCGRSFCNTHRHSEAHDCSFDFKKAGRIVIEKQNPTCKADKLTTRI